MKKKASPRIEVPVGYKEVTGDLAPIWKPSSKGEFIQGECIEDRLVKSSKGRKKIETRLISLKDAQGHVDAVWVSAGLERIIGSKVKGRNLMIVFEGLRKIKGQGNPMKVFRVFEKDFKSGPVKVKNLSKSSPRR